MTNKISERTRDRIKIHARYGGVLFLLLVMSGLAASPGCDWIPGRGINRTGDSNCTVNIDETLEGNQTFAADVIIDGELFGGSQLKIAGGVNITTGDINVTDGNVSAKNFFGNFDGNLSNFESICETSNATALPNNSVTDEWADMGSNILLLHYENSLTDDSGIVHTLATNNLTFSSTEFKLGSYSGNFTDSYINITPLTEFNSAELTLMTWFKHDTDAHMTIFAFGNNGGSDTQFLLSIGDFTGTCANELFGIGKNEGGVQDRICYTTTDRNELFDDTWHHIAMTGDGTEYKLYVDGVPKPITVGLGSNDGDVQFASINYTMFGGRYTTAILRTLTGFADETAIFNRSLSPNEINEIYNTQKSDQTYCLRNWWSWNSSEIVANSSVVVDGNLEVYGELSSGSPLLVSDSVEISKGLEVGKGITSTSSQYGIGLMVNDYSFVINRSDISGDATFNGTLHYICDFVNDPFIAVEEGMFLTVLSSADVDYTGGTGEITDVINSSCVHVDVGAGGNTVLADATSFKYQIYEHPSFAVLDNGVLHSKLGESDEARFHFFIPNGTGFHGFIIDDTAGADHHQAMTVDTDTYGFDGVVGINSFLRSSQAVVGKSSINLLLEADATNYDADSHVSMVDMRLIGETSADTDAWRIDPNFDHILHVGSADTIDLAYYDNTSTVVNVTQNFTTAGSATDMTLFENDDSIIYIGSMLNFSTISVSLDTDASQNLNFDYFYCNGTFEWVELSGVVDTTNGFTVSGTISFIIPDDFTACNRDLNDDAFTNTTNVTYVAIQRTRNFVVTDPVESLFSISGGSVQMILQNDMLMLNPVTAPPETCSASFEGALYFDSDVNRLCFCDGSNWLQVDDSTTGCS